MLQVPYLLHNLHRKGGETFRHQVSGGLGFRLSDCMLLADTAVSRVIITESGLYPSPGEVPSFAESSIRINRFNAGSIYIRRWTHPPSPREAYIYALPHVRIHRFPPLAWGGRFQPQLFTAYRTTQACPPGYMPTSCVRSLRACARESGCQFVPLYRCYSLLRSVQAS